MAASLAKNDFFCRFLGTLMQSLDGTVSDVRSRPALAMPWSYQSFNCHFLEALMHRVCPHRRRIRGG
jgi:hypothetical protein